MLIRRGLTSVVVSPSSQVPGVDYVEINGRKSPESIPEWLAWHEGLTALARSGSDLDSVVFTLLSNDAGERKIVGEFATRQAVEWNACRSRQIALLDRLKGTDPSTIQPLLHQKQVRCRIELLDAKNTFLKTLSPRMAFALRTFVDDNRKGITSLVPQAELDHYRRPR